MNRLRQLSKKTWMSNNKSYEITVWIEKGEVVGEMWDRKQGKRYSLNEALSMDRDYPYFPADVSENLNRLIDEVKRG